VLPQTVCPIELIVYFENKLVLWKSVREITPITTAQTKYTDCVHSNTEIQFKLYVISFKVCKYTGGFKKQKLEVIKKERNANNL